MKPKIPFYYHIIFFTCMYLIFTIWDIAIYGSDFKSFFEFTNFMFSISFSLAIFTLYLLNFYTFCDWFLNRKKFLLYIISLPITLVLFGFTRYFLQEIVVFEITGYHNYFERTREMSYYLKDNLFFGLPAIILSTIAYLMWQFLLFQKQNQQLILENKKAEFQLLKSQVSPHFLFNTLNSFYSDWIEKDAETAADLLKLSDLLRYVITETDKEQVLLSKEIQFIENYIQLQQKRFENQLHLDFSIEGNYKNETILPTVLIHFVENVFKHGKLNEISKKAIISIKVEKDYLEISTSNHIQPGENYSSTGIGFENITKRLKYTYNDNFQLEKTEENNIFKTKLKMPLKR